MLAQNFKTAADLQISDKELDGLVKVLGLLEREEVPLGKPVGDGTWIPFGSRGEPMAFQMLKITSETDCGTACCIMGWAKHLSGDRSLFMSFDRSEQLDDLFAMGGHPGPSWRARANHGTANITPFQAAIALRNYLTHGEPRWDEALAEAP